MGVTRRGKRPPQIIVAADGTGDYTTIAAALAVVPAGGATVLVKRGTYTLSAALAPAAKTTIRGEGQQATIIQAPVGSSLNAFNLAAADITLEDLQIDGLRASQPNVPGNGSYCGVYVTAARATIRRCYVHDTRNHGVLVVNGGDDFLIEQSRLENVATSSAGIAGYVYPAIQVLGPTVNRPKILHNSITGWCQGVGLWFGVLDGLVEGNRILANYGYADDAASAAAHTTPRSGIEDYGANNTHGRNKILNNTIDGCTLHCLEIAQGVVGSIYTGNTLTNPGKGPATTTGSTFVVVGATGQITTDILVSNNTCISDGSRAENCLVASGSFAQRVTIEKNTFSGYTVGSALFCYGVAGLTIDANTFYNSKYGIYFDTGSVDGAKITNNEFRTMTASGASINITAGNGHIITGNRIETALGSGIAIGASSARNRIEVNHISGCSAPLSIASADNVVLNNYLQADAGSSGAVQLTGAGCLRNLVRFNTVKDNSTSRAVRIDTSADYNLVQDNHFLVGTLSTSSPGVHNITEPNHTASLTKPSTLVALGAQTVGTTPVTVAHGLGYAPTQVVVTMTSAGTMWKSAASDATNVTLTADSAGRTAEVYVR